MRAVRWLAVGSASSIALLVGVFACTVSTPPVRVRLTLGDGAQRMSSVRSVEVDAMDYSCFGLLVTGEGIPSLEPGTGNRLPVDYCSYAGAASRFVTFSGNTEVEALVPPGRNRRIQVVALDLGSESFCPNLTVAEFLKASHQNLATVSAYGGLYEIGYTVRDVFGDTTAEVTNTYDAGNPLNLRTCSTGLPLTPPLLELFPKGPTQLEAGRNHFFTSTGGTPPYTYTVVGGGSIGSTSGLYFAPASPGVTATVTVADSSVPPLTTSTFVTTHDFTTAPLLWFVAGEFSAMPDGTALTAGNTWSSRTGTLVLSPSGSVTYRRTAVNGLPALRFSGGGKFSAPLTSGFTVSSFDSWMVARINNPSSAGSFLCVSATSGCSANNRMGFFLIAGQFLGIMAGASATSSPAAPALPTGYFLAHAYGNFGVSSALSLTVDGGAASAGGVIAGSSFSVAASTGHLFLGPADGQSLELDVAEWILEFTPNAGTQEYLRQKYQLY